VSPAGGASLERGTGLDTGMFDQVDKDSDGHVSVEEFLESLKVKVQEADKLSKETGISGLRKVELDLTRMKMNAEMLISMRQRGAIEQGLVEAQKETQRAYAKILEMKVEIASAKSLEEQAVYQLDAAKKADLEAKREVESCELRLLELAREAKEGKELVAGKKATSEKAQKAAAEDEGNQLKEARERLQQQSALCVDLQFQLEQTLLKATQLPLDMHTQTIEMFNMIDADADGWISRAEFCTLHGVLLKSNLSRVPCMLLVA